MNVSLSWLLLPLSPPSLPFSLPLFLPLSFLPLTPADFKKFFSKIKICENNKVYWNLNLSKFKFEGFHVAQMVKNLPAVWETSVWSLSWEDSLEKGMAIHTISQSLLKLMLIELVMPSNHLILCPPLLLLLSISPSIRERFSKQFSNDFPMNQHFTSGGQSMGALASA